MINHSKKWASGEPMTRVRYLCLRVTRRTLFSGEVLSVAESTDLLFRFFSAEGLHFLTPIRSDRSAADFFAFESEVAFTAVFAGDLGGDDDDDAVFEEDDRSGGEGICLDLVMRA